MAVGMRHTPSQPQVLQEVEKPVIGHKTSKVSFAVWISTTSRVFMYCLVFTQHLRKLLVE